MKFLVLGAGRWGAAAAYDLARSPGVERVLVADLSFPKARDVAGFASGAPLLPGRPRPGGNAAPVEPFRLDAGEPRALRSLLGLADAALSALPPSFHERVSRAAVEARVHLVDLGGSDAVLAAQHALDPSAREAGVRVLPAAGLSPGLSGVLAAEAARGLDRIDAVRVRWGSLLLEPKGPLGHLSQGPVARLLEEYVGPARLLRGGRLEERPALTEVEEFDAGPPFGRLEAFLAAGGLATLPESFEGAVREMDAKALRHSGHAAAVRALLEGGLAPAEPDTAGGKRSVPREVLEGVLARALVEDGPDAVLLEVTAEGERAGERVRRRFRMVDRGEPERGLSATARSTAFPAAAILRMAAFGEFRPMGVLRLERVVPAARLREDLALRGLEILEGERSA